MDAIILAAGFGTRLGALGKKIPKALLPVGGSPLKRLLEEIESIPEVEQTILVSNGLFLSQLAAAVKGWKGKPVRILNNNILLAEKRSGSVKDLALGLRGEALVLCSDRIFTASNLRKLVRASREQNAVAVLYQEQSPTAIEGKSACLVLEGNVITRCVEKPEKAFSRFAGLSFYAFPKGTDKLVQRYLDKGGNPDAPGYFLEWLVASGERVVGVPLTGECYDLGTPEALGKAKKIFGMSETPRK